MGKIINMRTNEIILDDLQTADTFLTRFRGLMGVKAIAKNMGLRIAPCNSVHCFFMRFPIDVIFLDKQNQVIHIQKNMKPGSISPIIKKAKSVIEANADTLSTVLELGDKLAFYD